MCLVYNEDNLMRQYAAEMLKAEFDSLNNEFDTNFNCIVTAVPWGGYSVLWRGRVLPLYIVAWGADYPDAHNFVSPYMDMRAGAFARFQMEVVNSTITDKIDAGIASIVPSERQAIYTWLQQEFVNVCYSIALSQPTVRYWERDWVQGWFYHPVIGEGIQYAYDRWKEDPSTVKREFTRSTNAVFGSLTISVTIENTGEIPEYVGILNASNTNGNGDWQAPYYTQNVGVWLPPKGHPYYGPSTITITGIPTTPLVNPGTKGAAIKAVADVTNWTPEQTVTKKGVGITIACESGDLGTGPPPKFFKFDGKTDSADFGMMVAYLRKIGIGANPWKWDP